MDPDERQISPTLDGIREDHTARYLWAKDYLEGSVLDAACGVGYGSKILSDKFKVRAVDIDSEAIQYAEKHYSHENILYCRSDIHQAGPFLEDSAVVFEMIEHIKNPLPFLQRLSGKLIASVPNEDIFPYIGYKYHFRHYTRDEFEDLLNQAGFKVESWWGQRDWDSGVEPDVNGRTLIAIAGK